MTPKPISQRNHKRLQALGTLLKVYRLNDGLSQYDVTQNLEVHMHRNTISRIENANGNPTLISLFALSDYYQIPIHELFAEIE